MFFKQSSQNQPVDAVNSTNYGYSIETINALCDFCKHLQPTANSLQGTSPVNSPDTTTMIRMKSAYRLFQKKTKCSVISEDDFEKFISHNFNSRRHNESTVYVAAKIDLNAIASLKTKRGGK